MPRSAGFTLIELLVVIVIMGVIIGSVSLTLFDSEEETLEQETHRLLAVIEFAQQQATLDNRQLALGFSDSGYGFLQLQRDGEWSPYEGEPVLGEHAFPEALQADLYLDGIRVTLDAVDKREPQIFILSSGEMQPFEVVLRTDTNRRTIRGDSLGGLEQDVSDER